VPIPASDIPWLLGAVLIGGVIGPVLLMIGLTTTTGASASLLLNLEGVFTALIAWIVFRENFDKRIAAGMALIIAGGVILALEPTSEALLTPGALAVALACLAWAVDNNLTRRISAGDASVIAAIKGGMAGVINLTLAAWLGVQWPSAAKTLAAASVGLAGYGISLALFVVALRGLGTARTGAYFSTAPFVGVALSLAVLQETPGFVFWVAGALMAAGVWLHISERHEHEHEHEPLEHDHTHVHDEHHRHTHDSTWDGREPHTHRHTHAPIIHTHPHYPDLHHRHH
jgi:drug/metabolite transporter (DMT)-like permease